MFLELLLAIAHAKTKFLEKDLHSETKHIAVATAFWRMICHFKAVNTDTPR